MVNVSMMDGHKPVLMVSYIHRRSVDVGKKIVTDEFCLCLLFFSFTDGFRL
jgi:hypothetical protein